MSASILTTEQASKAKVQLIDSSHKGAQAVHDVVVASRAARRSGSANAKTRAEVSATNRKPWRQKGTGRARAGSYASPIWRGGGVVFGPKPRDYAKKVTKSVRRLAFRKALSERIAGGDVLTTSGFDISAPKTKEFVATVRALSDARNLLLVGEKFEEKIRLAARNCPSVQLVTARDVSTEQLLSFEKIIVIEPALATLAQRTA